MHHLLVYSLLFFLFSSVNVSAQKKANQQKMNNDRMEEIFKAKADKVEGESGVWQIHIANRILLVLTDESNNRMRIFTPIIEQKDMEPGYSEKMLEANFHSALDAKYGLYNEYVVSLFTHPLQELTAEQLVDAMYQVVNLANTFGTTFSSTDLLFGGGQEEEEEKRINKKPSKTKRS